MLLTSVSPIEGAATLVHAYNKGWLTPGSVAGIACSGVSIGPSWIVALLALLPFVACIARPQAWLLRPFFSFFRRVIMYSTALVGSDILLLQQYLEKQYGAVGIAVAVGGEGWPPSCTLTLRIPPDALSSSSSPFV